MKLCHGICDLTIHSLTINLRYHHCYAFVSVIISYIHPFAECICDPVNFVRASAALKSNIDSNQGNVNVRHMNVSRNHLSQQVQESQAQGRSVSTSLLLSVFSPDSSRLLWQEESDNTLLLKKRITEDFHRIQGAFAMARRIEFRVCVCDRY